MLIILLYSIQKYPVHIMPLLLTYKKYSYPHLEAGIDEAGRGPLAGPVVAAAVILPAKPSFHTQLKDSKKLTEQERYTLYPLIKKEALAYGIGMASPGEIDKINILQATFLAMHKAIKQLITHLTPDILLVDGNKFKAYPTITHHCIVKGDQKYASIASAAILAKCTRDTYMQKLHILYPSYRWSTNKGYPTIIHKRAIQVNGLTPYHRISFRGCKLKKLSKNCEK